ncbi:type II methionyl aminopeptidase [Candidatus Pacearchaeota archaeon]|nr:type II methionyl aminopeptidase [Candidatus Pacearchaeota archaeon]
MAEKIENWKKAGQIARDVSEYAKSIIQQGVSLSQITDLIELKINELGAKPAFPVNLSINETAAHYTPTATDPSIAEGLLKVDLGVNYLGYLADTAFTIDLTPDHEYSELIKAAEDALGEAIKIIKPGITVSEIGAAIESKIRDKGYNPIRNLSGHEIKLWNLHAGLTIPNYNSNSGSKLKEGMIIAIEPFATTGKGMVKDGRPSGIYKFIANNPIRDTESRKILQHIMENYATLPFAGRWIIDIFGNRAQLALNMLQQQGILYQFAHLNESSNGMVSQAEHTILVTKNGCEVLTI